MKVLLAGDTHCNRSHVTYLFNVARDNDCSLIIQLGDFGFWPRHKQGSEYLEHCQGLAKRRGVELWWLDGNHEDHDFIDAFAPEKEKIYTTVGRRGALYPNLKYLSRGARFELDGVKFIAYGGAFSVDRAQGAKFVSWFPQEMIDLGHVESLSNEPVDVLLSHDVPTGFTFHYDEGSTLSIVSKEARDALYKLVQKTKPKYCFGGHHHLNGTWAIRHDNGHAQCFILNCDGTLTNSYAILDLDELKKGMAE
jgi:predicted phosphodiesterase